MEDAVLVDGKNYVPNCLDPENASFGHMEDWSFRLPQGDLSHAKANTEGSDDRRKPNQS